MKISMRNKIKMRNNNIQGSAINYLIASNPVLTFSRSSGSAISKSTICSFEPQKISFVLGCGATTNSNGTTEGVADYGTKVYAKTTNDEEVELLYEAPIWKLSDADKNKIFKEVRVYNSGYSFTQSAHTTIGAIYVFK